MIRSFAILIILNLSLIILTGCSDDPASIGRDLLKDDQIAVIEKDSYTDTLTQYSSYFKRTAPLRGSTTMLLGKKGNVEASFLLKFFLALTDTIAADLLNDSINVVSAKIIMTQDYTYGDSTAPFDFSVHSIISGWTDTTFTSDSLASLNYDPVDVSSNRNYINNDSLEFDLDNALALSWLKAQADTNVPADNGIFFQPSENSQKVAGFTLNPLLPTLLKLSIVIEKSGDYLDTLAFAPLSGISVVLGSNPSGNNENIIVQNSVKFESKLWFDLSSIPKTALINYAELTLTLDTIETITGSAYTKYIRPYPFTDSSADLIDASLLKSITRSGNLYTGEITRYVQNWVNGTDNQGMLLTAVNLGEGVELLSFKGSNSADLSVRPRLKIVYSIKR